MAKEKAKTLAEEEKADLRVKAEKLSIILDGVLGGPGPSDEELAESEREIGISTGRYRCYTKRKIR